MFSKYANNIEFIRAEFGKYYVNTGPENGRLQGMKYDGASTHCRRCLYTLTNMIKPRRVLEIGSYHYETSSMIGNAMDELFGDGVGTIDSFDIKIGGYDGMVTQPTNSRVRKHYWYPHKSDYDEWKLTDPGIVYKDFVNYTNDDITRKNSEILISVSSEFGNKYDMIFMDGDHSYEGIKRDFEIALAFSTTNTLFVIDNVWDVRLKEVRRFYDELKNVKWDFESWNDDHYKDDMVMDTAIVLGFEYYK